MINLKTIALTAIATLSTITPALAGDLKILIEENCTKYGYEDISKEECHTLSESQKQEIKAYWQEYGVNITFDYLKPHRHNIYSTPYLDKEAEKKVKEYLEETMERNGIDKLDKFTFIVKLGKLSSNTFGQASFKHNIFLMDTVQTSNYTKPHTHHHGHSHHHHHEDVVVNTFNHELGHSVFKMKHVDDETNLMHPFASDMTDTELDKKQQRKIDKFFR